MEQNIYEEAEAILNSLKNDLLVTGIDGTILRSTKTTSQIYGMDENELIGRSVYDLEKEGIFKPAITPLIIKKKKKATIVQTTADGKRLLVTGIPVYNGEGEIYRIISYSHDITDLISMKDYLAKMEDEMTRVREELELLKGDNDAPDGLISRDKTMRNTLQMARQVAEVDVNTLLLGESGVGKTLIAKYIHNLSARKDGPFIEVNCGAIPPSLFEAEIFGYESGSFTGASRKGKEGLVELADQGTLFLDEVGELSMENQVKLLKLIQEKQFYRVGGTKLKKVDFRLVAATNQDLKKMVENKLFREDLYFRLNVVPIHIPSLKERSEDIVPLISYFLKHFGSKYNRPREMDEAAMEILVNHTWKGNVRELMNLIERLVVTTSAKLISVDNLPETFRSNGDIEITWDIEKSSLKEIIENVESQVFKQAKKKYHTSVLIAEKLGISQPTAIRKLNKYQIK
ncbi:sigma-54 interaction domain-containing protein [Bacillus massiliglaciei]|uniref:sigma-54 interaction domain-containing protein n=1 Tax=Bacillus massiliglaciei TaxID=1816693 RepID=UPI000A499B0D|nr:sigma 54-interacting transcriptional regulator [Bacillus massiliglaciei]